MLASSPSSRRAWIEIVQSSCLCNMVAVALLAEGVDRNLLRHVIAVGVLVALLAEGVDRNCIPAARRMWQRCRPPRGGRG